MCLSRRRPRPRHILDFCHRSGTEQSPSKLLSLSLPMVPVQSSPVKVLISTAHNLVRDFWRLSHMPVHSPSRLVASLTRLRRDWISEASFGNQTLCRSPLDPRHQRPSPVSSHVYPAVCFFFSHTGHCLGQTKYKLMNKPTPAAWFFLLTSRC